MNILEEAIIYSTVMHTGDTRKDGKTPYILHPLEVAQIISTITMDPETVTAGVLHDIVEDTDGSLKEIRSRFGDRVADLVASETENKFPDKDSSETWIQRKEESLLILKNSTDIGVKILWLADKLSNIRSMAALYSEKGENCWNTFNQKDPLKQLWYYKTVAELLEMDLNRTGAYKEFIKHINFIWPGTFEKEKTKYKKYREYSVEDCVVIGKGAKSVVYRYNDEVIIKVYNEKNTYREIERENMIARKAFVAGIPTAISFGIVKVGNKYGSMFELIESKSLSELISLDTGRIKFFANMMAELALLIHSTEIPPEGLSDYMKEVYGWVNEGLGYCDNELAGRITDMISDLPEVKTLIHGDFHTGNVMLYDDEPLLIDMDRVSICHPVIELSGVYMFYIAFGELNPAFSELFMGFSYEKQVEFFNEFMKAYLKTEDSERIKEVTDKAALLAYTRLIRRVYKQGRSLTPEQTELRDYYISKINNLLKTVDSLDF